MSYDGQQPGNKGVGPWGIVIALLFWLGLVSIAFSIGLKAVGWALAIVGAAAIIGVLVGRARTR